jgi:hypothetical protein
MNVLCAHTDTCKDNTNFSRPVFSIKLPEELFDLVFNSANGYRSWYFRSPYQGLETNALFVKRISDQVLSTEWRESLGASAVDAFGAHSAKLWLAEVGNEPAKRCSGCEGEWRPPQGEAAEVLNGRWECGAEVKATYGRMAPALTKLRVFGAFLDEAGNEFIPWRKRNRAAEIYQYGWS